MVDVGGGGNDAVTWVMGPIWILTGTKGWPRWDRGPPTVWTPLGWCRDAKAGLSRAEHGPLWVRKGGIGIGKAKAAGVSSKFLKRQMFDEIQNNLTIKTQERNVTSSWKMCMLEDTIRLGSLLTLVPDCTRHTSLLYPSNCNVHNKEIMSWSEFHCDSRRDIDSPGFQSFAERLPVKITYQKVIAAEVDKIKVVDIYI